MPKRLVTKADIIRAIAEDIDTGSPNGLKTLLRVADAAFKGGNIFTEKGSDWVFSHTGADGYRDGIKWLHNVLGKDGIEIDE